MFWFQKFRRLLCVCGGFRYETIEKKERQRQNPKWKCKCRAISWNGESIATDTQCTHTHTHIYMQANGIVLLHHIHLLLFFFFFFFWLFVYFLLWLLFLVDYVSSFSHTLSHRMFLTLLPFSYISWFAFTCFRIMRIFAFFCCCCCCYYFSLFSVQQFCHLFPMLLCIFSRSIFKVLFVLSWPFWESERVEASIQKKKKSNLRVDFVFFNLFFPLFIALFVYIDFISWFGDETRKQWTVLLRFFLLLHLLFFLFHKSLKQKPWPKQLNLYGNCSARISINITNSSDEFM